MILQEVNEITGPSCEPIDLTEVMNHSNITIASPAQKRAIIDIFIPAARQYLEYRTGLTFHQKTLEWLLSEFPECGEPIRLRLATPLISITSVKYKDSSGAEETWASSNYIADTDSKVGRLVPAYGVSYPSPTLYPSWPIKIRGTAGIAVTSPVSDAPANVKYPLCMLTAAMWENREAEHIPDRGVMDTLSFRYGVEAYIANLKREYAF